MKKLILSTLVIGTLGLSQAFGLQVTMGTYVTGAGGNYTANPSTDFEYILSNYSELAKEGTNLGNTVFGTFCLEKLEYFNPGQTYDVVLNDRAIAGGIDNHEPTPAELGSDIISKGTAFLYQKFATGALGGTNPYGSGWATDLQNMIWHLEDEQGAGSGTNWDFFSGLLTAEFGSLELAKTNNLAGGYGVGVMNLTQNGVKKQDQLVYLGVPDGGMTLALLGLGLAGLATIKRRFRI